VIRNVAEANAAARFNELVCNIFPLFACAFIPLGEVDSWDRRICVRHFGHERQMRPRSDNRKGNEESQGDSICRLAAHLDE